MPNLDMLLLKGPASGVDEGLNELRWTILADGIPANSEGMVRPHTVTSFRCSSLRASYLASHGVGTWSFVLTAQL